MGGVIYEISISFENILYNDIKKLQNKILNDLEDSFLGWNYILKTFMCNSLNSNYFIIFCCPIIQI